MFVSMILLIADVQIIMRFILLTYTFVIRFLIHLSSRRLIEHAYLFQLVFRKMADLKKEKELEEKLKKEPGLDPNEDHLVRKIFSRLRKVSDANVIRPMTGNGDVRDIEKGGRVTPSLTESPKPAHLINVAEDNQVLTLKPSTPTSKAVPLVHKPHAMGSKWGKLLGGPSSASASPAVNSNPTTPTSKEPSKLVMETTLTENSKLEASAAKPQLVPPAEPPNQLPKKPASKWGKFLDKDSVNRDLKQDQDKSQMTVVADVTVAAPPDMAKQKLETAGSDSKQEQKTTTKVFSRWAKIGGKTDIIEEEPESPTDAAARSIRLSSLTKTESTDSGVAKSEVKADDSESNKSNLVSPSGLSISVTDAAQLMNALKDIKGDLKSEADAITQKVQVIDDKISALYKLLWNRLGKPKLDEALERNESDLSADFLSSLSFSTSDKSPAPPPLPPRKGSKDELKLSIAGHRVAFSSENTDSSEATIQPLQTSISTEVITTQNIPVTTFQISGPSTRLVSLTGVTNQPPTPIGHDTGLKSDIRKLMEAEIDSGDSDSSAKKIDDDSFF